MAIVPQFSALSASDDSHAASAALRPDHQPGPGPGIAVRSSDSELADFIFVGTRRGFPIHCDKITLTVRTGTSSHQLALDLDGIDPLNSLDWTAEIQGTATITFTPPGTEEYTEIAARQGRHHPADERSRSTPRSAAPRSTSPCASVTPSGADPDVWGHRHHDLRHRQIPRRLLCPATSSPTSSASTAARESASPGTSAAPRQCTCSTRPPMSMS